jgi:hypothetical protein
MDRGFDVSLDAKVELQTLSRKMDVRLEIPLGLPRRKNRLFSSPKGKVPVQKALAIAKLLI